MSDSESTSSALTNVSDVGSPVIQDLDLDVIMETNATVGSLGSRDDAKTQSADSSEKKKVADKMHEATRKKRKALTADKMHETTHKKKKAPPETTTPTTPTPMTPTTPAPMTPRQPISDRRSPTPSFGARDDDRTETKKSWETETKKNYGDWHRHHHCHWQAPYLMDVGSHRVHAQSWWQLYRSSQYGQCYFRNNFGETLWAAKS